ncbi:hypothetical protein [Thiorhodococcus minor]|uniref:Uncharacterized protein n=1 Tax=Thiorhodococcus minor TaxID=57489 RepID=A0A6M0K4I7_9GAMM|nr:hypothetical protein [Thiorhodococcus minor]NEV64688.1 hypothetical protein [Thiorhodococcus minor]
MTFKPLLKQASGPALGILCFGLVCSAQALSLQVESGEITGVRGIEIQGELYDLTFTDGSFNGIYSADDDGYGQLARGAANALLAASDSGAIGAAANWKEGLKLRGCAASESCTILIPEHSAGAAPSADTTFAVEVIYAQGQFRSVTAKLWPFHAGTDTKHMPDMMYAVLAPAR